MVVITGGAGFIGSCLVRFLNDKGIADILVVDHLGKSEKWKNLIGKKFIDYVPKEVFREKLAAGEYENKIDSIFHLGACSSTTETNADYLFDNNYKYSIELAEYAAERHIRFIYASSAATYGDGSRGYSDKTFDTLRPLNCYGFTKHLFDLWVIENGLDNTFTGLKFFNVFGPNEYHKGDMASMAFKSYHQIKNTGKVKLFKSNIPAYGDGGQMRDFIYVKDAVEVVWKIYNEKNLGGIFNLGTGKPRKWNELASAVFAALGLEPDIEYIEMPEKLENQYQNYTAAEMEKLSVAGIKHDFMELTDSVNDYIKNHLDSEIIYY
jgi:ADP-L-glycero-D-manno-heptose 6-epimerase